MFTHAGFNPRALRRGRLLLWARIVPAAGNTWHPWRWAQLWMFTTGDVAWVTKTFISWPHQCQIHNIIRGVYVPSYLPEYASPYPRRTQQCSLTA